jgi:diacylglycerol kinase family enzyme
VVLGPSVPSAALSGALFINPRSGSASPSGDELAEAARARGIDVHVLAEGDDLVELARASDAAVLGAAGGDGTLAAVVTVALERDVPFVCVPFGTRNHFARDLGLDRDDPIGALAAFDAEGERRIDVGRIDGRVFLNNVSIGVYARLVHRREHHRRRSEAFARLRALGLALKQRHALGLTVDGEPLSARVVLVANNAYALQPLSIGERERLDEGLLHLYSATSLLPHGWEERTGTRFAIGAAPKQLKVAVDGEPHAVETPFDVWVEPQALRAKLPPAVEDERDVDEGDLPGGR